MKPIKFIVEIHDGIDEQDALALCAAVVSDGYVSKTSLGPQYCFHTVFGHVGVAVSVTKRKSGTQKFFVRREG